jgi:RNA polymerase sigma factor (TIGR02999 family)
VFSLCSQSPPEITQMLRAWSDGNREVANALVPLVYDELRRQARRHLRRERAGHTLQTTALVNEAYLKLIDQHSLDCESRTHFFAIAATLMRRILVDHAKTKLRRKRGGSAIRITLEEPMLASTEDANTDLLWLNEALEKLFELDEQQARIVELRYFSGLNIDETAAVLKLSEATVNRDWKMAKAWLRHELMRTV